jgi:hypothetical protein
METFDGAPAPDNGMDPEEVLRRSEAFDPTPQKYWTNERLYRMALLAVVSGRDAGSMRTTARHMLDAVAERG